MSLNDRSAFYKRMTEPRSDNLDVARADAWVQAFIDALCDLEGHHEPRREKQPFTLEQRRKLEFLRHRVESGEVLA